MTIEELSSNNDFAVPEGSSSIIKVIGVGGGGSNAVQHMYEQGIDNVSFVICNTDRQALNHSTVPNKLQLGESGLGAGNKPEVGRKEAEDTEEQIADLFKDNTKMVFITAGMGGGTGTGAAPVVARIAREHGMLTIGIVTIPFVFEGRRKIVKALEGAEEMSKYVDALLVINNERLTEIYPDITFLNGFGKADDTLSTAARGISELITNTNHVINIDFKDVDTTLRNGGAAVISIGYGEGDHRVTKAINDALNSPLLKDRDIFGSRKILFNIYFNPDSEQEFLMGEANELSEFISNIDENVDVIWGLAKDNTLGNKVKITLLAAGFDTVNREPEINRPVNRVATATATPIPVDSDPMAKIQEAYGVGKASDIVSTRETQRRVILTPEQMTDDAVIDKFENNPTYSRERRVVDDIRSSSKSSKTSDTPENDEEESESTHHGGTRISFT